MITRVIALISIFAAIACTPRETVMTGQQSAPQGGAESQKFGILVSPERHHCTLTSEENGNPVNWSGPGLITSGFFTEIPPPNALKITSIELQEGKGNVLCCTIVLRDVPGGGWELPMEMKCPCLTSEYARHSQTIKSARVQQGPPHVVLEMTEITADRSIRASLTCSFKP